VAGADERGTTTGGKRAATIHDVANAAGASISTVSRSFHMPELVRPQTRERVLRIAAGLGYVPNRAARGLITGRTGNIGLIVPDIANPFFPALVKAAQARARAKDYSVFLADTSEDPVVEAQLIRAMAKQVDGVIACSSRMAEAKLREIANVTSLVLVNRRLSGVPAASMDMAGGIRQAVEHLHALGHRSCVYLAGPRPSWSNRQRQKALKAISDRLGIDLTILGPFDPGYEAGLRAADQALAHEPTAIVAFNDLIALGVMARLGDRGVAVPDDVSVVGFDDIQMAAIASPPLTTVWAPTAAVGEAAVDLLLGPHAGNGRQVRELRTELRVRSSTGPPPEAGRTNRRRSGGRRVATTARAAREE
jgi:DNA-binding LacI/PurR family transcriptional regulator